MSTVKISKQGTSLGIAIEGGSDTLQREPRIINIQARGVAFETAGLRVGQVIKEVDGVCLTGKQKLMTNSAPVSWLRLGKHTKWPKSIEQPSYSCVQQVDHQWAKSQFVALPLH